MYIKGFESCKVLYKIFVKLMVIRLEKITIIDYEIKFFHKKKDKEQKEDIIVIKLAHCTAFGVISEGQNINGGK